MEMVKTLKLIEMYLKFGKFMGVIDVEFDSQTQTIRKVNKTHHSIRYFSTFGGIVIVRSVTYLLWI